MFGSCLPPQPCSSCVLRQTEAYCYTDEEPPPSKATSGKCSTESSTKRTFEDEITSQKSIKMFKSNHGPLKQSARSAAQTAIENIEYSVEAVKQYISTEAKMTDEIVLTSSTSTTIEWDELVAILPPLDEIRQVINCYFSEVRFSRQGTRSGSSDCNLSILPLANMDNRLRSSRPF